MQRLDVFAFFHLNLAFSSIEEEQRPEVVARCYWPLLRLPDAIGAPVGIEATGYTLECINMIDPAWIAELRRLMAAGKIDFIGSGYAQLIGPLVPAAVNRANLEIGQQCYQSLLGQRASVALVNEQAFAAGLVPLYREAGFQGLFMDWDNVAAHHPEWPSEYRYHPQRARGADGSDMPLMWTHTMAFQKLQRLAHGDIEARDYFKFIESQRGREPRVLPLYSNDAEVFDFRPKRFHTEDKMQSGEWQTIANAWQRLASVSSIRFVKPSQALTLVDTANANNVVDLPTSDYPVPVKKHKKYNITRWAVSGRDDIAVNASCHRILRGLVERNVREPAAWKELCYLWSSDFRTHITENRWKRFRQRLAAAEEACALPQPAWPVPSAPPSVRTEQKWIEIETPTLQAVLNRRRGLAIQELKVRGDTRPPMLVSLLHGFYDVIDLQADWYSGNAVFEAPGVPKVSDLEWTQPVIRGEAGSADAIVEGTMATPLGPIFKQMRFSASEPTVFFDVVFDWKEWGRGSLRLGHVLLNPEAFDRDTLHFASHGGGDRMERFALGDRVFDHGKPVSFLVSASTGLGMTEGVVELGDASRRVIVTVDRETAPLVGLMQYERSGDSFFARLALSGLELDDTRKPEPNSGPRRFRFAFSLRA